MNRAETTGLLLMAGSVLAFVLFVIGALRRSYVALVLPLTSAMLAVTAIAFWLGWTMYTLAEEEAEEQATSA